MIRLAPNLTGSGNAFDVTAVRGVVWNLSVVCKIEFSKKNGRIVDEASELKIHEILFVCIGQVDVGEIKCAFNRKIK